VLFWRYSAFAQWQKWLFTFGYLPFYEFSLIARNYAVGMALLFAICALWPSRWRAYWPLATLIALLANSHVYALWMAIALGLTLAVEQVCEAKLRPHWLDCLASGVIIIAGCGVSLYSILPPAAVASVALGDESFFYWDGERLLRTVGRLFAGYYTVIPNSDRLLDVVLCSGVAIAACLIVVLYLVKKPYALTFYLLANGLFLGFTYVKFMPRFIRHFGNFYLVLFAALWLAQQYPVATAITRRLPRLERWSALASRGLPWLLLTMLLVNLGGGLYRFGLDLGVPYSAGRAAAAYLRTANLQDAFIVGSRDAEIAPLSGHLGRPIYYPERRSLGSYTLFFKGDRREVDQAEVLRQVRELLADHDPIVLVLTDPLAVPTEGLAVETLAAFTRSQNETYHLYQVRAAAPHSPAPTPQN
ncbi:MAG TPA: hypothetical protein V6D02_10970, partial [Candidatus Obscuribacterales bacterium]